MLTQKIRNEILESNCWSHCFLIDIILFFIGIIFSFSTQKIKQTFMQHNYKNQCDMVQIKKLKLRKL